VLVRCLRPWSDSDLGDRVLDIAIVAETVSAGVAHDEVAVGVTFVSRVTSRAKLLRRSQIAEMDPVG
jgi:hypothetical protein